MASVFGGTPAQVSRRNFAIIACVIMPLPALMIATSPLSALPLSGVSDQIQWDLATALLLPLFWTFVLVVMYPLAAIGVLIGTAVLVTSAAWAARSTHAQGRYARWAVSALTAGVSGIAAAASATAAAGITVWNGPFSPVLVGVTLAGTMGFAVQKAAIAHEAHLRSHLTLA